MGGARLRNSVMRRRMSGGDAIIAGTALIHGLTLATRKTRDSAWIEGLGLVDPLQAPPPAEAP